MGRVLIVDDEPMLRLLLRLVLENDGHDVRDAPDAREGLIQVGTWRPDVVVTELSLAEMGGAEWVKRLRMRAETEDMRVVATSASVPVDVEVDAAFVKPYEAELLAKEIDAMLDDRAIDPAALLVRREDSAAKSRSVLLSEIWSRLVNVDAQVEDCDSECDLALEEIRRLARWIDERVTRNRRQGTTASPLAAPADPLGR